MGKRRWAVALVVFGLVGAGSSAVRAQLPPRTVGPAQPTFPYNLPPAPAGGPHLPALPTTPQVRAAPQPRSTTFA